MAKKTEQAKEAKEEKKAKKAKQPELAKKAIAKNRLDKKVLWISDPVVITRSRDIRDIIGRFCESDRELMNIMRTIDGCKDSMASIHIVDRGDKDLKPFLLMCVIDFPTSGCQNSLGLVEFFKEMLRPTRSWVAEAALLRYDLEEKKPFTYMMCPVLTCEFGLESKYNVLLQRRFSRLCGFRVNCLTQTNKEVTSLVLRHSTLYNVSDEGSNADRPIDNKANHGDGNALGSSPASIFSVTPSTDPPSTDPDDLLASPLEEELIAMGMGVIKPRS